ncbi:hypothetical protein [Leptospira harrisiae]|uniref:hypothetical protein n=1 Tax=Leptospira harrisiae TaxID=2023189 RepID=UPI000C29D687|nr:hypothetical protein [Leptospira harrisiae]PKA08669.1 hypothetical protein CH366_02535 [Leptospira harrisiae]
MNRTFLILLVLFSCTSLEKNQGSIGRQLDLIEDLEKKLPEEERPRFRKAVTNIRDEERISDNNLKDVKTENKTLQNQSLEVSTDAGKWYGTRNTVIGLIVILVVSVLGSLAYWIFKTKSKVLPIPGV